MSLCALGTYCGLLLHGPARASSPPLHLLGRRNRSICCICECLHLHIRTHVCIHFKTFYIGSTTSGMGILPLIQPKYRHSLVVSAILSQPESQNGGLCFANEGVDSGINVNISGRGNHVLCLTVSWADGVQYHLCSNRCTATV